MNSESSPRGREAFGRERLENDPAVIFSLDHDLRIVYCNAAWDRFAQENGGVGLERGAQLGRSVMSCVPDVLKAFFEDGYRRTLASREPWQHSYECSSPSHFRSFRMMTYAEPDGSGLLVVNSLTAVRPHEQAPLRPELSRYVDDSGILKMCCHCRRVCQRRDPRLWDWVPELVAAPPEQISHCLCAVCLHVFYPDVAEGNAHQVMP